LSEVAGVFLKLGATSFGGPAVHVAAMEDELVHRRGWLDRARFMDLLGATQLIPGPNSTEMAIHIGLLRAGWPGFAVAGLCFILPSALLVAALAAVYRSYGALPALQGILYGVKPVVIAVVAQALWRLGKTAVKTRRLAVLAVAAAALCAAGMHELAVLFGGGLLGAMGALRRKGDGRGTTRALSVALPAVPLAAGGAAALATAGQGSIFLFFLKVGSVLFGSGYVLLAFLRNGLVLGRGWLTDGQLLDAFAVGQVTPGPVFTTATFIGYILGGGPGAAAATAGIFLPAFVLVALSGPLIPKLRQSPGAAAFLDGLNVASLALMAVVGAQVARQAVVDLPTALLAAVSAYLLFRRRVNAAYLVPLGAAVGWFLA
jgi:chromate transporter